jgi:hypothetical protein
MENLFTPVFGKEPQYYAGRAHIIADILGGLKNGTGDPNRSTVFIGPRGSGKTVLLSKLAREASATGWITANVTAREGMLENILEQAKRSGKKLLPAKAKTRLSGITILGYGFTTESVPQQTASWRYRMTDMLEILKDNNVGLLITVDELDTDLQELVTLVSDYQHFIREDRNIALVMAGLPGKVLQMFQHKSISFVRRAFQHKLDLIGLEEVKLALRLTIESSGRTIDDDALNEAAKYAGGFPFLIQLIGYHIWRQSPNKKKISFIDVERGIAVAKEYMDQMILETTMRDLSEKDIDFLLAMRGDTVESKMSDIIKKLGVSSAMAGQYRLRLIKQGVIEGYGRGIVRFALPMLKDYLIRNY